MTFSIPEQNKSVPLLEVDDLRVSFINGKQVTDAVRGVSFALGKEKLAIVGESGSGKSTVGRALLKLHPASAQIHANTLRFAEVDLLRANEAKMREVRGKRMSMIMQDPKYSLNPVVCVGDQVAEAYLAHHKVSRQEARERVLSMFEVVRIRQPQRVYSLYPHEVSGGQGQRIMIAMMLITGPEMVIADEPTSALDADAREAFIQLLFAECREAGASLLFVSHDQSLAPLFDRNLSLSELNRAATTAEV